MVPKGSRQTWKRHGRPRLPRPSFALRPLLIATLVLLALVLAGGGPYFLRGAASSVARRPAARMMLLVLPLENLSGDPEQEYFREGLTDEMITKLAQGDSGGLRVNERGS